MLVCGVPEEVEAVASGLAESYSVMVQDDYESPVAFADRTAGDDCDDQIGAVVFLNRSLDQHGALLASANLRAVLDRCFHDAPVIVVAGEQAEGASGPGVDRILAV
ncbi:MAG: hypothetical protein KTR21_10850 [Rhodobacteraceae bacterium]|nr:hypothetical protein [Paracoccaceae bacterium]